VSPKTVPTERFLGSQRRARQPLPATQTSPWTSADRSLVQRTHPANHGLGGRRRDPIHRQVSDSITHLHIHRMLGPGTLSPALARHATSWSRGPDHRTDLGRFAAAAPGQEAAGCLALIRTPSSVKTSGSCVMPRISILLASIYEQSAATVEKGRALPTLEALRRGQSIVRAVHACLAAGGSTSHLVASTCPGMPERSDNHRFRKILVRNEGRGDR
jgi:hypothetical protein